MIFLSRMKDEGIVIGNDIVITVADIQGDEVELNIEHPPGVAIEPRNAFNTIDREVGASP